jgi:predicted HicB family RNase H-like nuclease
MTAKPRRKPSSKVGGNEVLRDRRSRVVDDQYVEGAVESAVEYVRGRGRPSLSKSGESPLLRVRVSQDLEAAVRAAARTSGQSVAEWVRRTLETATKSAG